MTTTLKLTNRDLVQSIAALSVIGSLHLKAPLTYRIGKIVKQAGALNQDYEEARLKLLDQFAKHDDEGKIVQAKDGSGNAEMNDRAAFEEELKKLQDIEIEIVGEPIKIADLGDITVPANVFAAAHWLIVD